MRWLILVGHLLILALPGSALAGEDASSAVSEVKSAFVYNFIQFTRWPTTPEDSAKADLILCVYARGAIADALSGLEGKPLEQRRIRVKVWPDTPRGCHVVYLATASEPRALSILYAAQEAAALTIAEDYRTPAGDVDIGLFDDGDRLGFAVNLDTARKKGFKFSSKLLRLAKSVFPRPEDEP